MLFAERCHELLVRGKRPTVLTSRKIADKVERPPRAGERVEYPRECRVVPRGNAGALHCPRTADTRSDPYFTRGYARFHEERGGWSAWRFRHHEGRGGFEKAGQITE